MSAKVTKYVAEQLRNLLGTYVDGVSEETLNLQLLGGKMQLENLSIRETAFAELEMPFKASGRVGKMGLSINLLKFWWNEPVIISLHDVEIVLEPLEQGKEMDPADFAAHFERIRKWKEAQVHAIQEAAEGGGGRAAGGFLARLGKKIRENLQIHINDFRIEYIDRRTPESAFTAGLYLGSLVAMSSEDKEHAGAAEGEAHGGGGITEKALEVRDFYFFVRPLEDDALRNRSAEVSAATRKVDAEYQIIRPVHLTLHFTINDEHQLQVPQYHLDVRVDKLEWIFIRRQYLLVHKLMEEITAYRSRLEHWFWRPRAPPLQAPRAWFKYAGRCVREQVHHRRFAQQHGERYGRMYTAHLLGQDSAEDKEELARLERHMAADALAALRSAAKQAASAREAAMAEAKKEAKSKQTATWGGWAKSFVASSVPADFDTTELDEESREMLTEALQQTVQGEGSDGMEVNAFPREYARFSMDLAVEMGSLTLVQSGWAGEELVELAYAQFDALEVEYQIRRDTYRYAFTLESLRMDDRLNSVQGLNQIASCRQFEEGDREKILRWDWDSLPTTDSDKDGGTLNIVVDGLSLVYSVDCVLGVYNFWMVPKEQRFPAMPEGAQAAEEEGAESSESQLQLWRDRTRFDKRMKWELVMKRPCMLFPADHHSSTEPVVVLELDHITWSSAISDAHEAGFSPLALPDFFDRNVLSAEQTRFLLVKDVGQWLECGSIGAGSNVKDQVTIANNFNFKMVWDTCKLTEELRKGQALAKYDLAFRLPEVELSCTAEQYSAFWYTFFAVVRSHYPPQPPSTAAEEVAVSQEPLPDRSFVFSFDADDMRLRMKSADESSAAVALLSLKGFNVVYENGSRSTLAFGMNRLDLEGIAGGSVLFATSAVSEGASEESFVCIKRGWNHAALPDHPGYDQWWDLRFRGLVLNWNDKTVAALMEYTSAAFKERAKPQIANEQQGEAAVDADHRIEDGAVNDSVVSATRQAEDQSVAVTPSRLKTQVTASIELLRTTLMRDGDGVAKLEMSALTCKYELGAHGSKTTGKLGNFVVEDLSRPDTLFQEKLGLRDTSRSVVEFELSTYSASGAEHPGYDSMLVLEMSSTRLVYMKRFVDELRAYIAAEPLISGIMGKTASAVAESAKKAAGHHRRGQGLAKVRCKLVNPLVVLPVEDSSEEHLVADLGEILLENRFSTEGEKRIEHFEVGVKAMNLQEGGKSHLMENVDVKLLCSRELSQDGSSGFAEIDLTVSDVCAHFSESQVLLVASVQRRNLGFLSQSADDQTIEPQGRKLASTPAMDLAEDGMEPESSAGGVLFAKMGISSLQLTCYSQKLGALNAGEREPHTRVQCVNPSVSYALFDTGEVTVGCTVSKMEVVHEEAKQAGLLGHVLRYYEEERGGRQGGQAGEEKPQLQVNYGKQGKGAEGVLTISLFRPEILLLPDSLVAISNYVMALTSRLSASSAQREPSSGSIPNTPTRASLERQSLEFKSPLRIGRGAETATKVSMEILQPRISFVEQGATEQSAKGVLQSTIRLEGVLGGAGARLQSCSFEQAEMFVQAPTGTSREATPREESLRSVVDPFDMSLEATEVPHLEGAIDPGMGYTLRVKAVEAQVSYQDWLLAVKLNESWQEALRRMSNLGARSSSGLVGAGSEPAGEQASGDRGRRLMFGCEQIGITVINDCFSSSHVPVLEVRVSDLDGFMGPSKGTHVLQANLGLEADYFNMQIAAWEPVLERWPLSVSRQSPSPGHVDWRLTAVRSGEVNLTQAFVECVSLNSRTIQRALSEVGDDDDALHSNVTTLHPYHVHNNLGVPVACRTEAEGSDPDMVQELAPGDCVPMDIKSSRKKQRKRLAQAQRMWLTVGGGDVWEPSEVRIDRVGKQNLVLKSVDPKGTACKVVCNIVLEEGSKHIKLSSSVKVLNKTMHPLSLLFEPDGSQPQEGGMFDLEAEGSLIVPVQLVAHCHLRVQPTERHNWSKPLDLRAPPVDAEGKPESRVWLYNAGGNVRGGAKTDGDASFFVWVRATSPDGFLIRIILTPIITVVNQLAVPMHYQLALEPRKTAELGPIPPGGKVEHHQISPEQSAFLTIKLPGFACSSPARIQVDRRVNHDAELHREVSCKEEGEALSLAVAVNNFVVRDKPSDTGRDRNVTLSCPFWIKNLTGIPLSFCVGNPSLAPTSEYDPHEQAGAGAAKSGRNLMLPVSIAGAPEWMSKSAGALVSHAGALGVERGESKMAGQRDFNAREQALNTCSNGLVDQPFRTGAACMEPPVEYPALMLSFPRGSTRHDLYVKVAGSQWSDAIQVGKSGASGMVEILNEPTHQESRSGRPINNGFLFQLSLTTQTISQRQFKTEVLVFRPKYVIVNNLQKTLHYKQVSTDAVNTVRSQHKSNFHWPCASAPHELSIRIAPPEQQTAGSEPLWHWSGSFSISALGETHIRLRSKDGIESAQIVRVEVKNLKETLHVILHPENEIPPYRINNASSLSLMTFQSVQQRDDDAFDLIEQRASMPFAWDHPLKDKRLSVSAFGVEDAQDAKPLKLNIDAIGAHPPLVAGGLSYPIVVRADGPTKVLTISDPVAEGEDEDEDEQGAAGGSMRVGAARVLSVSLSLSRVGFNLVDITPQELVSCYLEEVQLTLISRGRDRVRVLDLSVGSCQVDNMLARTPVPVIVHSSSQQSGREHAPFFKMLVEQDAKDSAGGVTILKRVQAELKDIQLSLEGRIVVLTFVYYLACRHLFKLGKGVRDSGAVLQEDEMELFKATTRKWIYFEQFALPAVNVVFTFVRRDLTEGDALPSLEVLNKVSWLAASVDDASLSLNELEATHVFMDLGMLMGFLQEHYQKECMRQFYRLLGSVEVLGNPAGLLRNLNTGMRAFTAGLRHGDRQSLKDGAKTFVKHGTHGVSNTISKVSSSFSRGLASVSLDEDFLREREENKDHKGRPQSMQVGFSKGASNLGKSAFSGFTGFFKKPLEGYQQGGMGGFVEGVGVGVAGLLCKPTSGLLDLVANTTEGLRNQTNPHGKAATHSRCREPREMQKDDPVLKPLDSGVTPEGELMARLKTYSSCLPGLRRGELWNDTFIKHMSLPHGLLVFTNFHCIFTKYLAPAAHADDALGIGAALNMEQVKGVVLVWHLQWKELVAVEVKDDALVLQADPAAKASWEQQRISECGCLAEDACRAVHDAWNLAMEEDEAELVA